MEEIREIGPYWVRMADGQWRPAEFDRDEWSEWWVVPGDENGYDDEAFLEIGPRLVPPTNVA